MNVTTGTEISGFAVLLLGLGIVFLGLILLIAITKIMSSLCGSAKQEETKNAVTPAVAPVSAAVTGEIPNRQQFVAAAAAAIATYMNTDVSGLRIISIKKV